MEPPSSEVPQQHPPVVIAFINPRSGGGLGQKLMEKLASTLGDDHVFDLTQGGPEAGLKKWKRTKNLRVIAGGGDGTVGWVLSICDKLKLKRYPYVVPMPLGTANDMSRVLRWGSNFTSAASEDVHDFVDSVKNGVPLKMDRWHLTCSALSDAELQGWKTQLGGKADAQADDAADDEDNEDEKSLAKVEIAADEDDIIAEKEKLKKAKASDSAPRRSKSSPAGPTEDSISKSSKHSAPQLDEPSTDPEKPKEYVINNYFSIGFDSQVMLDFHEQRHKSPGLFIHPVVNKAVVGVHGLSAGFQNVVSPNLHKFVHFELDGKPVKLPKRIHALVVLQIPSYASGTDIWGSYDKTQNQSQRPTVNDGLFEVIGIKGILHLGRMFTGISTGLRLGQGKMCTIVTTQPIAMQVDGEPYWLEPARCDVAFHNQGKMLFNMKKKGEKKWTHLTGLPPPGATPLLSSL